MGKEHITGLLVRGESAEWTTLQKGKEGWTVLRSGRLDAPPAAPEPAPGKAAPPAAAGAPAGLAARLKAEAGTLPGRAALGLESDRVLLRVVALPEVDESELAGMVQMQVAKFSPLPVEDMVVSYERLGKRGEQAVVLIGAARAEDLRQMGERLAPAGIVPARVDAAAMAWWRLFTDAGEIHAHGRQSLVIFDGDVPELIVTQEGSPIAFRTLPERLDAAEAEWVEELAGEVGYTLMSLELEHGGTETRTATIWSRAEAPGGLAEKLSAGGGGEVRVKSLDAVPPLSEGIARRAASAGAVTLDLTPVSWRTESRSRTLWRRLTRAGLAAVGVWALTVGGLLGALYYQKGHLARLKAEQKTIHGPAMEVREMRRRVSTIERYMDRRQSALETLREVSELMPPGIDLTAFSYRKGEEVKLSGAADSVNAVYAFKDNLSRSPFLSESTLQGPRHDSRKNKEAFDIDIKVPGGAP